LGTKKPPQTNGAALEKRKKNESQDECKTAATGRAFRNTACWAVSCFIHWWLLAFTMQNYPFLFWTQGYVSQKTVQQLVFGSCFLRCARRLGSF
jgi:hypothetical protein